MLDEAGEALLLLLPGEPEVAEADLVGLRHLSVRPHARVLTRVHRRADDGDVDARLPELAPQDAVLDRVDAPRLARGSAASAR